MSDSPVTRASAPPTVPTAQRPLRHRIQRILQPWLLQLALIILCTIMLFPIFSTVMLSLKTEADVRRRPPVLIPCDMPDGGWRLDACRFALDGYRRVFLPRENPTALLGWEITGRIFRLYMPNTLLYATASALLTTLLASMAAYAFSRYRFRGRQSLLVGVLALSGVPLLTMLLALYRMNIVMRNSLAGYDERAFMIAAYVGFELPFAIWLIKGFFDTIPRELEEAARMDGASRLGALGRIVAPLAAPGMASILLLSYVNVWNEFIANYLLMTRADYRGVMYGVYDYIAQALTAYNALAAACIIVMFPMIAVFLATRNVFLHSMVEGALKG
ncbi:MAG: carbohydrate ABC transporter permease [Litorilinea sp.]